MKPKEIVAFCLFTILTTKERKMQHCQIFATLPCYFKYISNIEILKKEISIFAFQNT